MTSTADSQVIVVGAGPGGLFLACELALAGIRCTVLERRADRSVESRATGLQPRTLEMLAMRGIVDRFLRRGHPHEYYRLTVGAARIDLRHLDTAYRQLSICRQSVTEELLEEHALALGARVERGMEVLAVRQTPSGVVVEASDGSKVQELPAQWVVGFDGTHSNVRKSAGIAFPGKTYPYSVMVGDVRLARPPEDGMLVKVSPHGMVVATDFGDGTWRMGAVERSAPNGPQEPASLEELRAMMTRIFGYDLHPYDATYTSRFRFRNMHAATYRSGRVLLGGDAAHVHAPLGAQGLNISFQDAMNLGWKLAAVIRKDAPESLLDTYELERRPVAHRVLKATDKAMRMMMSTAPPTRAMVRLAVPALTGLPRTHRFLAGQISNLALGYPPRGRSQAELVGRRIPDSPVRHRDGSVRTLYDLFRSGRFVLLDQTDDGLPPAAYEPLATRMDIARVRLEGASAVASYELVLCRPDGYCAWAGGGTDVRGLRMALEDWGGVPHSRTTVGVDI